MVSTDVRPGPDHSAPVDADRAALAEANAIAWTCRLRRHAHLQPDRAAIEHPGGTLTYGQLDARIDAAAGALAVRGVGPGDRVAILAANHVDTAVALGAVNRLGALGVPVNFRLVAAEIAWLLADSGATAMVVDGDRMAAGADAQAETGGLPTLVLGPVDAAAVRPDGWDAFDDALAAGPGVPPPPTPATLEAWRAESTTLVMYTSGTTGRPKGAMLTHLNLLLQTITQIRSSAMTDDRVVTLVGSPLFHIAGVGGLVPSLMLGVTVVLAPGGAFDPLQTLDLMERHGVTGMFLVPTQWQVLCAVPGIAQRRLALRTMSWGASPALPSTLRAMAEAFPGVANVAVFGQTEMSPVTCALDGADAEERFGSVGKPVATVDIRVVDEDMADVAPGDVGEIVYRGPSTMAGYWGNPQATADALRGGWFHSGDLVRQDPDGFVYVVDRKKDMIVSGGENIYSSEVEAAIDGHPKVAEVAVVGVPHPTWVETPMAVVTPVDPADPPTAEEIIEWTRTRLASYKKPTVIRVVDALPRNASGKVLKHQLRAEGSAD